MPSFEVMVAAAAAVACALLLTRREQLRVQLLATSCALALGAIMAAAWSARASAIDNGDELDRYRPADRTLREGSRWASSRQCASCHPAAHDSWKSTHHAKMTQVVSPDTVLARWQGTLEYNGRRYHLLRRGDRFMVDMPLFGTKGDRAGERIVRPIVMSTGSHHQQLFWLPLPWADLPPDGEGAALFAKHCATCHGDNGDGGDASPLRMGEMFPWEIRIGYDLHVASGKLQAVDDTTRDKLLAHVARLQKPDRLVQFPFSWLIRDQRWVHEDHTFIHPEPEPDEVEPYDEGWSDSCDGCHAVAGKFRWPEDGDYGRAAVAELGIACESCHGPGAQHVERHRNPLTRYATHLGDAPPDDIVLPTRLDKTRNAAVCGHCHAETYPLDDNNGRFYPGNRLEDHTRVVQFQHPPYPNWLALAVEDDEELLESGFWRDGTIRISGRDYNGLAISKCHTEGELTCTTCHGMHGTDPNDQLKPKAQTDAVCIDCHQSIGADPAAHSHHDGAVGCYDCHMPRTTLGLLSVMRAHRVDIPSASVAFETGRPMACALCHVDRSEADIADAMARWWDHPVPDGLDDTTSAVVKHLLSGDAVQRAVAAWHLGWDKARRAAGDGWQAPLLAQALADPYAAVRYMAGHSIREQPGYQDFAYDYVADPSVRARSIADAMTRYRPIDDAPPETLVGKRGLMVGRVAELQAERDNSPVTVNE